MSDFILSNYIAPVRTEALLCLVQYRWGNSPSQQAQAHPKSLHMANSLIWQRCQLGKLYSQEKALENKPLQGWNFGTMTKSFDLLTRTIIAAPEISGAHFWFQSTRSVVQEGSHLWWWQMESVKQYCKTHCETCTFLPARDGQPKIITPAHQQQTAQWPSVWGKDKHGGNGFSSLIA